MARPKPDAFMRHEPVEVVKRRPITQRNLAIGVTNGMPKQRVDDDAESFGTTTKESAIVAAPVRRDRTPKGVNDGRGKRSVADVLLSHPTPEGKAVYMLQRVASLEDQISKLLDLGDAETLEIVFKRRPSLRNYVDE